MHFSIVIPILNEESVLPELLSRVKSVLDGLGGSSEVIFIDDGSTDNSVKILHEACQSDIRFRLLELSRNFGHQYAITAGLHRATGDAAIIMDGDLQDPPELIVKFIEKWQEGYDVVYGVRTARAGDSWHKKFLAKCFYKLISLVAERSIPMEVGDFRLIDKKVLGAFNQFGERRRFLRGIFACIGYRQVGVPYQRDARFAGKANFTFWQSLQIALDAFLSFSRAPSRGLLLLGSCFSTISLVGAICYCACVVTGSISMTPLMVLGLFLSLTGSLQILALGLVAEYVYLLVDEVKARPLYVIKSEVGFDREEK